MPKVTFLNEAITLDVQSGRTIKEIADAAGVNLFEGFAAQYNCSGRGMCLGKGCRVWVVNSPPTAVSERTFWERIRRQKGAMRLACQTRVLGDVEIRTQPGASLDNRPNMTWEPDPRPARWKDRLGGSEGDEDEDAAAKTA